ncbi:MAG: diguanylate cyclase, partial [Gallionella sp.]
MLAREISNPATTPQVQIGDSSRIMGQWKLFLKPRFNTSSWIAVAVQPLAIAQLPVSNFSRIFIGVVVLALLMVALLSVSLIRRTMGPLEKLINGTRRVADEDFDHRVDVVRSDEFGELAISFNNMAGRLGSQLGTLQVLSSIDQTILAKKNIDLVFEIVLKRIRKLSAAGFICIIVPEEDVAGDARIYFFNAGQEQHIEMNRIKVNALALDELVTQVDGFWSEGAGILEHYILRGPFEPAGLCFILPILAEGSLCAFVCLEFANKEDLSPHIRNQVRDLGGRIGVALSSAARDEHLIYQARHDDLTGLPNRLLFKERLSSEIAYASREKKNLALLFVDLDHFKNINDTLGHSAGDELLRQVAQRLYRSNRESDAVARLGGDEFAIILPSINGIYSPTTVAEHLLKCFSAPFEIAGLKNFVSASIGIAVSPADGDNSEDLLRNADTALYRAKELGRGRFVYFEDQMNKQAVENMTLEREMRQGILHKEFVLMYQPKLDLHTGKVAGAEALIRWNHPSRGFVYPATFIGIAEDTGLIGELGKQVIWDACIQNAALRMAGINDSRIAINVSRRQFQSDGLIK